MVQMVHNEKEEFRKLAQRAREKRNEYREGQFGTTIKREHRVGHTINVGLCVCVGTKVQATEKRNEEKKDQPPTKTRCKFKL